MRRNWAKIRNIFHVSNPSLDSVGLFGISRLTHPSQFKLLATDNINAVKRVRDALVHQQQDLSPKEIIIQLDTISNMVCSIIDPAELCRNVHTDPAYVDQAEESFSLTSDFIHELNSDQSIYNIICSLCEDSIVFRGLTAEEQIFLCDLKCEYESNGIQSDEEFRGKIVAMQSSIISLESSFMQAISNSECGHFQIGPLPVTEYTKFNQWMKTICPQSEAADYSIICPSNKAVTNSLLTYLSDRNNREALWQKMAFEPRSNIDNLISLIRERQQFANSLGYKSHIHKFLQNKAMKSTDHVLGMLRCLRDSTQSIAMTELEKLKEVAVASTTGCTHGIAPWDLNFLINKFQAGSIESRRREAALQEIQEYLSFEQCLDGLIFLCKELFSITFKREKILDGESWIAGTHSNAGENLLKFCVVDEFEKTIGILYLDPWQRPGKFPGSAHFTIQCGCKTKSQVVIFRPVDEATDDEYQLPVVALVLSFGSPGTRSLTIAELEILYHEWGHSLHSLMSRTQFQHLSGTRAALDFAEVPSHLFEYFARHPPVVGLWARHKKSGRAPPQELLDEVFSFRRPFAALELHTQILYSAADQYIFGDATAHYATSLKSPQFLYEEMLDGVCAVQEEFTCLPIGVCGSAGKNNVRSPAFMLPSHNHFVTYGGGYYSYLFARSYAAQIWEKYLARNPLNRIAGQLLHEKLLKFGAAKCPNDILSDLVGPKIDTDYLVKNLF